MIDKKNPRQGSVKTDSADDDVIIDLTDEIVIKTEEDENILELTDDMTDDLRASDDKVKRSDVDADLKAWESSSRADTQEEDMILELDDQFADDENDWGDDELIASAINESLGPEENETDRQDDDFGLKAPDDDVIILENERDMVDESLAETTDDDASDLDPDTDVFDLEEDIELEYEMDEDEDELIALDDERTDEQPDFVSMVLGETVESGRRDQSEEPTEYIEFDAHRQNDKMDTNETGDEEPSIAEKIDEEEAPENIDIEDLPELASVKELDFEDDDETNDVTGMIQEETDSSDDIIARTVGQSIDADAESDNHESAPGTEFESEDDEDVFALDVERPEDEEIVALENGESLEFEETDSLFINTGSVTELEDDDEIIPLEISDEIDAAKEDEIVEITEFDQHYPTDRDKMLEQAGILDASEEEDDFLELIEVEDDRQTEDEKFFGSGESEEMSAYAEIDKFFNDASEAEKLDHETTGPDLNHGATDGSETAAEEAEDTEDTLAQESAGETAAPGSDEEAFDFNFDPGTIAQQVDRLDAFLSDEPEPASLPEDYAAGRNDIQENIPHKLDSRELSPPSPEQIDTAIERVINEKFSGRIESIIYEVIEKAVAKEIDRLKGVLLDSTRSDDI